MKDICIHTNTKVTFYERYLHVKSHKAVRDYEKAMVLL